ncbi:MAG: archaeal flagellar protein FlaI [Thermoplasmata archaeon]|jgi:flagellar protein FlaI|nr:archaeal flagellar protein FlaI [Thermoplasmata archaeon]
MADEDGEPQPHSLAERLRQLKMREASEGDEDAVRRALQHKATLSERMKGMLEEPAAVEPEEARSLEALAARTPAAPTVAQPGPVAMPDDAGALPAADEDEAARFSQRLRGLRAEEQAAQPPTLAAEERKRLLQWFLGRETQQEGSGSITAIPPYDEAQWEEAEFYPIEPPFSFVRILRNRITGEFLYQAIEPELSATERQVLEFVQDALVRGLNVDPVTLKQAAREQYLLEAVRQILRDYRIRIDGVGQARIEYYVRRDFIGLGPIHPVMVDPRIEDISCDGPGEGLFIFHRNYESIPSNIRFPSDGALDAFVIRLAQRSGKAISISDPILDAALPDGSRLQATLGREVTQNGSTFTIRRFKPDPFTPIDLLRFGTMSVEMLAWFWMTVQKGHSMIFSGGTASGKTTALNAIAQFIPPAAKVVSIEDTREVNLPHKNWIKAVTRAGATGEGVGEIGMFELLKASLRQRPEFILVGEVRGIEATVAFQAMATGHTVFSTMHADSARSVVYRLENEPINIPRLVLQALDIIAIQAQARVHGKRVRRIKEVVELVGMDPATKELLTNTVFKWDQAADRFEFSGRSYLLDRMANDRNWTREQMQAEFRRRQRVLQRLMERTGVSVEQLTELIKAYYRDPDGLEALLMAEGAPAA